MNHYATQVVTKTPGSVVTNVAQRVRDRARETPDSVAVEAGDSRLSYAALDAWADELAEQLVYDVVGPTEPIFAVAVNRSPAQIAATLAIFRVGATFLPIDVESPPERNRMILEDADPAVLIHDDQRRAYAALTGARLLHVPPAPAASASKRRAPRAAAVRAGTAAYLMFTSGSTGRPKGVHMVCGALDNLLNWHLDEMAPVPGRRVAQFTAPGFDIWIQEVFSTLVSGATLVIPGTNIRRDPAQLARWLDSRRITDLFCPNVVLEAVAESALQAGLNLPHLSYVAQAGEQLTLSEAVRTLFTIRTGRRLFNHYGPTETHAATSTELPASVAEWPRRAGIGSSIHRTWVHLLDSQLRTVPEGEPGELYVSGSAIARGYYRRPGLTAERFLPCPWGCPGAVMYRTGDIARRQNGGQLEYLGRSDQQVKIRGVRVEIGEVEAAVRELPEVRDVVVLVGGEGTSRRLDCYVVPASAAVPDTGDLDAGLVDRIRAELTATLLAAMVPASFTLVRTLPTNSNGKVDRNALPLPTKSSVASTGQDASAEPGGSRPGELAELFAQCLDMVDVDDNSDFFALGGHSLSAVRLTALIRSRLGYELGVADIFANPTVATLAAALHDRPDARTPVRPRPHGGDAPASFAQARLWVIEQFSEPSALYNVPIVIRLRGPVDPDALRIAVRDVRHRHEALRTRLVNVDGRLLQQVAPMDEPFDCRSEPLNGREPDTLIQALGREPFDLETDEPLRATVVRVDVEDHLLVLVAHHALVDGWSLRPLLSDLGFAYVCRCAGLIPPWSQLTVSYGDYADWQRAEFEASPRSAEHARLAALCRARLAGAPEIAAAATDRPRPLVAGLRGGRVPVRIPPELHRRTRQAAQANGCTVFMVVHAALALLLRDRGAGNDVVVGATVAGRRDGELNDLVGLFVNTLVLRVDFGGLTTVRELLAQIRADDLAALSEQELPFDLVVEEVNPRRSLSANPVVQVMLAFQTGQVELVVPGVDVEVTLPDLGAAKFDLTFELTELEGPDHSGAGGIVGHLEFSNDLYDRDTAVELASEFMRLLNVISGPSDVPLPRPSLAERGTA